LLVVEQEMMELEEQEELYLEMVYKSTVGRNLEHDH
jgi:hypothetical protein